MRPARGGDPRTQASCSKARPSCPASAPRCVCSRKRKPPGEPGGFGGAIVGEGTIAAAVLWASAAGVGAALPEAGAAGARPAHAQQNAEAALLSVVQALVERLGGVGELLERG